jgi:predicted nucleotidyltransferase
MKREVSGLDEVIHYFNSSGIRTCILYGSAGTGSAGSRSDIDLAIAGEAPLSSETLIRHYLNAVDLLHREVDLVDLRNAKGLILKEILTKGDILINNDPEFLARKAMEMMDYQSDLAPGVNEMLKKRLERALYGK